MANKDDNEVKQYKATTLQGFAISEEDRNALERLSIELEETKTKEVEMFGGADKKAPTQYLVKDIKEESATMSTGSNNNNNNQQIEILLKQILEKSNSNSFEERITKDLNEIKSDLNEMKISVIKVDKELDNIKTNAEDRQQKLKEVHEAIFNPFQGIYKNLNDNKAKFDKIDNKLDSIDKELDDYKQELIKELDNKEKKLELKISKFEDRIDRTDGKLVNLEKASGGEDFSDLKNAVESHKNFNKLWWALIAAVFSGFGKFVWDMVKELNQQ